MALKTFVKVNNITNLSDARYCAGMGVDQLGFCIDPTNENYISNETLNEITGWISGIDIVSEMNGIVQNSTTELVETNTLNLDDLIDKKIILRLPIDEAESQIDKLVSIPNLEYVMVAGDNNLDTSVLKRIEDLANKIPVVLGFGINKENINSVIKNTNIKGIALSGSNEIRPGFKDYDELGDILEAIEED